MAKKETNKYRRLLSNTLLFGISTFSSKVLSFLLTRLYTGVLAEASFGLVDLVTTFANLLIPLVSLGISNAVIRFGLEKGVSKKGVFTCGLTAILCGFGVLILFTPLMKKIPNVTGYLFLLYVYVLVSCLRTLCCQFVRSRMYTKLYAIDGILSTIYTIGFNVLFLIVMDLGPTGYLLSIICADLLSTLGLTLVACLWQYVDFRHFNVSLFKKMLRYSLPLVPALMFWWVTNASDRIFVFYMCGPAENGLYAAAYKVPTIVTIFSTIFLEAWQLSAVTDGQDKDSDKFFTKIFQALSGVTFIVGGGLIIFCQLIMKVLVAPDYFIAWQYIPFLVVATVFSCLVAFLNSVYMVKKKSGRSLATMLVGASANLILNAMLIPQYGPNGAALATFFSYALLFVVRALDTQKYIKIQFAPFRQLGNTTLLVCMAFLALAEVKLWPLWCSIILCVVFALNAEALFGAVSQLLKSRKTKKSA